MALVHVSLGASQRHDVTLTMRVGECDLHLVETFSYLADTHTLLADHSAVESLLNDDVTALLILLVTEECE